MEITYQLTLDKNYTKAVKKISRDIYKHNKFRKIMRIGDFLLYLFCLIPSLFIAFYMTNWAEVLYDYYENMWPIMLDIYCLLFQCFLFSMQFGYDLILIPKLFKAKYMGKLIRKKEPYEFKKMGYVLK